MFSKASSNGIELTNDTKYQKVQIDSQHGGLFSIEEETEEDDQKLGRDSDDDVEISFSVNKRHSSLQPVDDSNLSVWKKVKLGWSTITFAWLEELLKRGNEKPLEKEDLLPLPASDTSEEIFSRFSVVWNELRTNHIQEKPKKETGRLLMKTFAYAFGKPFVAAGILKLIHDSSLFMGPLLLNKLIRYLNNPNGKFSEGMSYVVAFFFVNLLMSLCLRQYFWWCYRVGMNLRSAVITSVYAKSLIISPMTLARKTVGEITNLMSVDSGRLQELTPYLHAVWYSFFQIIISMYFLWNQMGVSCLSGLAIIVLAIPMTGKVSGYMKTLQRALSTIRDTRIKLTNEVLSGMKVIKLQAWEEEFLLRIKTIRAEELTTFRKYAIAQSLSGALYTTIPILVAITTFMTYIALGNTLNVATALTALALFEILRFPLFMLPTVLNNLVEAKVSIDRVEGFLLSPERYYIPKLPLHAHGLMMSDLSGMYDTTLRRNAYEQLLASSATSAQDAPYLTGNRLVHTATDARNHSQHTTSAATTASSVMQLPPMLSSVLSLIQQGFHMITCNRFAAPQTVSSTPKKNDDYITEDEMMIFVKELLLQEAKKRIEELEIKVKQLTSSDISIPTTVLSTTNANTNTTTATTTTNNATNRMMSLSNMTLSAQSGELICVIGSVGSGKTTLLQSVLGNIHLLQGRIACHGKIAYASQLPFIQNSTIEGNILFGKQMKGAYYQEVLERCALERDLEIFPAGDQTEIGERGINLSGGQKSRIGLARALYANADIYLLDDPLSAVDAHVGQHLFDHAIYPLIQSPQKKCVILVTNALQYVKYATQIVFLTEGKTLALGSYDELLNQCKEFRELMTTLQDTSSNMTTTTTSNNNTENNNLEEDGNVLSGKLTRSDKKGQEKQKEEKLTDIPLDKKKKEDRFVGGESNKKSTNNTTGQLIVAEDRETGNVNKTIYYYWCLAAGGLCVGITIIFLYYGSEGLAILTSLWLSYWSQSQKQPSSSSSSSSSSVATAAVSAVTSMMMPHLQNSNLAVIPHIAASTTFLSTSFFTHHLSSSDAATATSTDSSFFDSPWFYLFVYMGLNAFVILSTLAKEIYVRLASIHASNTFFQNLLTSILYAPMEFYDVTPLGRIINRFSKDIYTLDEQIPATIRGYLSTMAKVTGTLLYIICITPMFLLGLIPMLFFYVLAQRYYIKTSRELTRIESVSRSPIYALFSETLDGMTTIRAYLMESRLLRKMYDLLDSNQQGFFLNFSANCWLAIRLEFLGTCIVTCSAFFAVMTKEMYFSPSHLNSDGATAFDSPSTLTSLAQFAGLAGLSVSLALSITQSLNWTVRMASDMESQMISVERIQHYIAMKQEASHQMISDPQTVHSVPIEPITNANNTIKPSNGDLEHGLTSNPLRLASSSAKKSTSGRHYWPEFGQIIFKQVNMRYREGLPLVLNHMSCTILPEEKIGIVGRTGAGKSSIVTALLRLVELDSGSILIDGVDIAKIGLRTLRSVIAVIPQDPVLFSGTIRNNLDPFERYTDEEIWEGLQRTLLNSVVQSLQDKVLENGANYSVGQRQLLCITRALLSKAKIIVMDEATAAVDLETDAEIQRTIRREFAHATCLTIAHRLNTILDSDKVLVMDEGHVAEFDTPQALLNNESSMFYALVNKWESSNQ